MHLCITMHYLNNRTNEKNNETCVVYTLVYCHQKTNIHMKNRSNFQTNKKERKKLYRKEHTMFDFYESISVLKSTGRILIEHPFIEYFPPNQLLQKMPVVVESLPRR